MTARSLDEIITHIRAVCDNPAVDTTLIQTEDLYALCDEVELRSMKTPAQFDDEAMRRVAAATRQRMCEKLGEKTVLPWLRKNAAMADLLARCTWLATREEMERK